MRSGTATANESTGVSAGGHGHARLQHHFDDLEQQREASTLGMWVFLCTDILFLAG